MIALAFLATAISHCADAVFCPTREELKAAVDERNNSDVIDMMKAANEVDPGAVWVGAPRRVLSFSNVYCGAPFEGSPKSVTCKLTFHYRQLKSHMIVRLERNSDIWRVREKLEVVEREDVIRDARLPF